MSRMRSSDRGRRTRRQFSEEFKEGAVRLVLDEGKTVGAMARELNLTASALATWVKHTRAELKEEREELTRLRKKAREGTRGAKKSRGLLRERPPVTFAWIESEKAHYPIGKLCRWLDATPSGFHAWRKRPESKRARGSPIES